MYGCESYTFKNVAVGCDSRGRQWEGQLKVC